MQNIGDGEWRRNIRIRLPKNYMLLAYDYIGVNAIMVINEKIPRHHYCIISATRAI